MSLNVETPVPVLYQSLVRAGWGELAGAEWQGVRSTLGALVARVRGRKTYASLTVWQVAQSTGLSEKWTARCLYILEGLGVIQWQRGFIEDGKPRPGVIQIMRAMLLELVRQAWSRGRGAWAAHRAYTARRLAQLKKQTGQIRRSRRTELSEDLNGISSAPRQGNALDTVQYPSPHDYQPFEEATTPIPEWARKEPEMDDSPLCNHGYVKAANHCPHCKRIQDKRKKPRLSAKERKARQKARINEQARQNMVLLERQAEEENRRGSETFRREHPCPPGIDPAEWPIIYIKQLMGRTEA